MVGSSPVEVSWPELSLCEGLLLKSSWNPEALALTVNYGQCHKSC